MRIDPTTTYSNAKPSGLSNAKTPAQATKSGDKSPEVASSTSDGVFTPTADLAKLLAAAKDLPEIRSEAIQDANDKLSSGELLSSSAAQDTAAAILGSNSGSK